MHPHPVLLNNLGRDPRYHTIIWNIFYHNRVRRDYDIIANPYFSNYLSPGTEINVIPDYRNILFTCLPDNNPRLQSTIRSDPNAFLSADFSSDYPMAFLSASTYRI